MLLSERVSGWIRSSRLRSSSKAPCLQFAQENEPEMLHKQSPPSSWKITLDLSTLTCCEANWCRQHYREVGEKTNQSSNTSDSGNARETVGPVHLIQTVNHMSAIRRHPGAKPAAVDRRKQPHVCKWLRRICLGFRTRIRSSCALLQCGSCLV